MKTSDWIALGLVGAGLVITGGYVLGKQVKDVQSGTFKASPWMYSLPTIGPLLQGSDILSSFSSPTTVMTEAEWNAQHAFNPPSTAQIQTYLTASELVPGVVQAAGYPLPSDAANALFSTIGQGYKQYVPENILGLFYK